MPRIIGIRLRWLLVTGLLLGMACSWPLWVPVGNAGFPMVPLFEGIGQLPFLQTILTIAILINGAFLLLFPAQKGPVLVLAAFLIGCFVLDLNTAQPWVWFSVLILFAIYLSEAVEGHLQYTSVQVVLVGVYGWGGLYKLTPYFAVDNLPWFLGAFPWLAPLGTIPALGYALALVEAFFVLGLCWYRTRRFTRVAVWMFHWSICLVLSPLGLNWNWVVIPWNLAMAGMVWVLFASKQPLVMPTQPLLRVFIGIISVGPAFNLLGWWPDAFSWKLYSNTQAEATFYNPAGVAPCPALEPVWEKAAFNNLKYLLLDDWSNTTLKVPLNSNTRVFWTLGRHLCQCEGVSDSAGLYLLAVHPWNRSAERFDFYPCAWLKKHSN